MNQYYLFTRVAWKAKFHNALRLLAPFLCSYSISFSTGYAMEQNQEPVDYCLKLESMTDRNACWSIVGRFQSGADNYVDALKIGGLDSAFTQQEYFFIYSASKAWRTDTNKLADFCDEKIFVTKRQFPGNINSSVSNENPRIIIDLALLTLFEKQSLNVAIIKRIIKLRLTHYKSDDKIKNTKINELLFNSFPDTINNPCLFENISIGKDVGLMILNKLDFFSAMALGSTSKGWNKAFKIHKGRLFYYVNELKKMDLIDQNFTFDPTNQVANLHYLLGFEKIFHILKEMYTHFPIIMESFPNSIFRKERKNSLYEKYVENKLDFKTSFTEIMNTSINTIQGLIN